MSNAQDQFDKIKSHIDKKCSSRYSNASETEKNSYGGFATEVAIKKLLSSNFATASVLALYFRAMCCFCALQRRIIDTTCPKISIYNNINLAGIFTAHTNMESRT